MKMDRIDAFLCRIGASRPAKWRTLRDPIRLYIGDLARERPQYSTFHGVTPFRSARRVIRHDVCDPIPLRDGSVELVQSEDVFEHIEYGKLPSVLNEIYRVLKPGGTFRLSVPDYRFPVWRDRSVRDESDNLLFDPLGGGEFKDGKVVNGGHVWFPTIETIRQLFQSSPFEAVTYLQHYEIDGSIIAQPTDHSVMYVQRSLENDARAEGRTPSIIADAVKA